MSQVTRALQGPRVVLAHWALLVLKVRLGTLGMLVSQAFLENKVIKIMLISNELQNENNKMEFVEFPI